MPSIATTTDMTWEAISVGAPTADIKWGGLFFTDVTANKNYQSRDGLPFEIPYGHTVFGNYSIENIGDVSVAIKLLIEIIDPDDVVVVSKWTSRFTVPPGSHMSSQSTGQFFLGKMGLWLVHGVADFDIA